MENGRGSLVKNVLIFGGTGAVGSALVVLCAREGRRVAFTYGKSADRARALHEEHGAEAIQVDLSRPEKVSEVYRELDRKEFVPDALIYAAVTACNKAWDQVTAEDWAHSEAVNCHSAWIACQEFARRGPVGPRQILLLGALDHGQSLPLPPVFAATQGKLSAMAMALGKELGPRGICVNFLVLGMLDGGMSQGLDGHTRELFQSFSALRRSGTAEEAARSVAWLALNNTYMTARSLAANGGI